MKLKILFFCMFVMLIVGSTSVGDEDSGLSVSNQQQTNNFNPAYTTHAPIEITSDADFQSQGWPGTGSKENPYLIEGLNITSEEVCIDIGGTSAYYKIKNCFISSPGFTSRSAIFLHSAPNGTVQDCVIEKHQSNLYIANSPNTFVRNNTISEAGIYGVRIFQGSNCSIVNNTISNNAQFGIYGYRMTNFTITNNTLENNGLAFSAEYEIEYWISHDISDNTVNGKELAFLKGVNNTEIDASAHGQTILVNCNNVTLMNGTYNNASRGIQFAFCTNATIRNNTAIASQCGIFQHYSHGSYVINNTARLNEIGFDLSSQNSTASNNTALENQYGMVLDLDYSTISHNIANDNSMSGMDIASTGSSIIQNTAINNSQDGFRIQTVDCNITQNVAKENQVGLNLDYVETSNFTLNVVENNSETAFYLDRVYWGAFSNNTISNSVYGMYISRNVYRCTLHNNTFQQSGIYVSDETLREWIISEDKNTVNGKPLGYFNGINNSQIDGTQYGQLVIVNSSFIEVENGLYEYTTEGVTLLYSDNCTLGNISSMNNSVNGYRISNSEDCILGNNTASDNLNYGFNIRNSNHIHLEDNNALDNLQHGFSVVYSDFISIQNNSAIMNLENGFHLVGENWNEMTDTTLDQNLASNNTNYGFYIEYGSYCNLTNNLAEDNGDSGIFTYNSANINLSSNEATQNGNNGVSLDETDYSYLCSNIATNNELDGFNLKNSLGSILSNNSAISNQMGFSLDLIINYSLQGNSAELNRYFGFGLIGSTHLNLSDNYATYNVLTGLNFEDSDDCIVYNNTAIQNGVGIEIDALSQNNLFYRNSIGYNYQYNGLDDSDSTEWDNGTHGNCWGDYDGSGSYSVDGLAGNLDNHPCVLDLYAPILTHPQDLTYELGTVGNSITWTPSDSNLDSYEIYKNGALTISSQVNESQITINVDGLDIGSYNFTIAVNDTLGKVTTDTVMVTTEDTTSPEIDAPEDIQYELGSTGNIVTWNPSDLDPAFYEVYFDGALMMSTSWDGGSVSIEVDGLSVGDHYVNLLVEDITGNTAQDTVLVEVEDTIYPSISSPADIQYVEGSTGNTIHWNMSDLGKLTYVVRRNSTVLLNGVCNNSEISLNVDFLLPGIYNYTVVVTDEGGNSASDSVIVIVLSDSTTTTTTTTSTTSTTNQTPPPEDSNLLFMGIAATSVIVGALLIVVFFVLPRVRPRK